MKKKKIISLVVAIAFVCLTSLLFTACDNGRFNEPVVVGSNGEQTSGDEQNADAVKDFEYELINDYIRITKSNVNADTLTVPATLQCDGKEIPVYEIADYAFENTSYGKIVFEEGVKTLGVKAFAGCSATEIVLPDTLETVSDYAFQNCKQLSEIVLPDSVKFIGVGIFAGCDDIKSLDLPFINRTVFELFENNEENIRYTDNVVSVTVREGIVCESAFKNCASLEEAWLGDSTQIVGDSIFENCIKLIRVRLADTTSYINDNMFKNCKSLEEVKIPEGVYSIGDYAFYDCDSLKSIVLPESVSSIYSYAFADCDNLSSIRINGKIDFLDSYAFAYLPELKYLDISNAKVFLNVLHGSNNIVSLGVTSRQNQSLSGLWGDKVPQSLKKVTVANSAELESFFFSDCNYIEEVTLSEGIEKIGGYAFKNCLSLGKVSLPSSLRSIGSYAFDECLNLDEIVIPDGVNDIGFCAFFPTIIVKLQSAEIKEELANSPFAFYCNTVIKDCDNNFITEDGSEILSTGGFDYLVKDGEAVLHSMNNNFQKDIKVPGSIEYNGKSYPVTMIREYAFSDTDIISIELPASVQIIGESAFNWCDSLKTVIMPAVRMVIMNAFAHCNALEEIVLPQSLQSIGQYVFNSCKSLTSLTIPANVTEISSDMVKNCGNLIEIVFENPHGWHYTVTETGEVIGVDFSDPVKNLDYFVNLKEGERYYI